MEPKIDPQELIQLDDINRLFPSAYFYKKEDDGSFSMCVVNENKTPGIRKYFNELTLQYFKKGLLYIRRNKPFQNFLA